MVDHIYSKAELFGFKVAVEFECSVTLVKRSSFIFKKGKMTITTSLLLQIIVGKFLDRLARGLAEPYRITLSGDSGCRAGTEDISRVNLRS